MSEKFDWGIRATWALPMQNSVQTQNDYFLGINNNLITFSGHYNESLKKKSRKFIDAKGKVLLPGLINAHTHLPMTLFRGLEDDVPLNVWLFEKIFPLEKKFVSPNFVKTGVELAALECIRFGTTTVSDMYFFNMSGIQAWQKAGLRGVFGQPMMDFPLPEDAKLGTDHFQKFDSLKKKFSKSDTIEIALAPHAPYTCGDDLLKKVAEKARQTNALIHIHVSEATSEEPESQKQYGTSQIQRLERLGILGPRTICAHAVHLSPEDIQILKQTNTAVVHNPDSNAKLGSGIAPIKKYLAEGIRIALGTDGSASANDLSLFGAMDLAAKLQKIGNLESTALLACDALWMATHGGAKALGLDHLIGSLEVGKRADFILVDFDFAHLQPVHSITSHLVYSTQGLEVDTVFCNGVALLRDKKYTKLKTAPIFKKAEAYRKKIHAFLKAQV